jgi:hypothetical protein
MKSYPFLVMINGEYAQSKGINLACFTQGRMLDYTNANILGSYLINISATA